MFEPVVVPEFGGGLRFDAHPAFIPDPCWSWSDGFLPREGTAEVLPGYASIINNLTLASGRSILDLCPHPTETQKLILVIASTEVPPPDTDAPYFYVVDATATNSYDDIVWDGTGTAVTSGLDTLDGVGTSVTQLGGYVIVSWGTPTGGTYSLGRWDNSAGTYTPINPTAACMAQMLLTSTSRVVAIRRSSVLVRSVAWSDANSSTVWDPAVSNSADDVVLDDLGYPIVAAGRRIDGSIALLSPAGQVLLTPTASIPAFAARTLGSPGCRTSPRNACVETPYGLCWVGYDDVYLEGQSIGRPVFQYYLSQATITSPEMPTLSWHPGLRTVIVPLQTMTTGTRVFLLYDPVAQTWSRRTVARAGADYYGYYRHTTVYGSSTVAPRHCLVSSDSSRNVALAGEATDGTAHSGAFVDTKDFAFSSPLHDDYTDRIKVDWEPLTNASTDAVIVSAAVHDDLGRQAGAGVLGSSGMQTSGLTFTSLGTLTAGVSELPVRLRGKYVRFRFTQSSGRVRIRGFTIRRQRASDRAR